jgi:acyl-CoA synthetase (AMP-forming)/AMP-acid ligase II
VFNSDRPERPHMTEGFPTSWRDPEYVAAVVGVLAVGAVAVSLQVADAGVSTAQFVQLLLAVLVPVVVAHELARRFL